MNRIHAASAEDYRYMVVQLEKRLKDLKDDDDYLEIARSIASIESCNPEVVAAIALALDRKGVDRQVVVRVMRRHRKAIFGEGRTRKAQAQLLEFMLLDS